MTHEEIDAPVPVVDVSKIPTDPNTPHCDGCGSYHGPATHEAICLKGHLAATRAALQRIVDICDEEDSNEHGLVEAEKVARKALGK